MSASPNALWSLFVAGAGSVTILVTAFAAALVLSQRRRHALQRDYASRVLAAHEEERANIARELHDDALQRVALIRHELDALWMTLSSMAAPDEGRRLRALNAELVDLGVTLRGLAQRLHPTVVEQLGLPRALEALALEFGRTGLSVDLRLPEGDLDLAAPVAHAAYRITQESLRNVARHAQAPSAEVEVALEPRSLVVRVRDRGRGFLSDAPSPGLGLQGMRERAAQVHGSVAILSHPGEGTTIEAVLPRGAGA